MAKRRFLSVERRQSYATCSSTKNIHAGARDKFFNSAITFLFFFFLPFRRMHKQTGFLIRRIVNRRILFVSFTKICTWGRQLYTHTDTHARARARAIIPVKKRGAFHTTRSDCARKPDAMNGKINILYGLRYDILRYLLAQRIFLRAL